MENSILTIKDYGSIHIHLKELLEERNMSRNGLARATHCRFEVIDHWYQGELERIDTDVLARICFVLNCNVGDLISYEKQ